MGFGIRILAKGPHLTLARHHEGEAVIVKILAGSIDLRLTLAMADDDGKSHATVRSSGRILCKNPGNPQIPLKKWCALQVSNLRPLPCEGNALPLS